MLARRRLAAAACARGARRLCAAAGDGAFSIAGAGRSGRAVYLDSQATTALDPRALDAMLPYMTGMYGNPHSRTHAYGWESAEVVEVLAGNPNTADATQHTGSPGKGDARTVIKHSEASDTAVADHRDDAHDVDDAITSVGNSAGENTDDEPGDGVGDTGCCGGGDT